MFRLMGQAGFFTHGTAGTPQMTLYALGEGEGLLVGVDVVCCAYECDCGCECGEVCGCECECECRCVR